MIEIAAQDVLRDAQHTVSRVDTSAGSEVSDSHARYLARMANRTAVDSNPSLYLRAQPKDITARMAKFNGDKIMVLALGATTFVLTEISNLAPLLR